MPIPVETPPPRRSLRESVHDRVLDLIVAGTLAPDEQLRDTEIATWLGVSRTPVREALLELGRSGLVRAAPGRATTVAPLDARAVRDARDVVAAMHRLTAEAAVPSLSDDDLDRLRSANAAFADAQHRGDVDAAHTADGVFHTVLVDAAGNAAASAVLAQYEPVLRRAERLRFASYEGRDSAARHARLIDACAAGDAAEAGRIAAEIWLSLVVDEPAAPPSPTARSEESA